MQMKEMNISVIKIIFTSLLHLRYHGNDLVSIVTDTGEGVTILLLWRSFWFPWEQRVRRELCIFCYHGDDLVSM